MKHGRPWASGPRPRRATPLTCRFSLELSSLTWQRIGTARKGAGDLLRASEAYSTALKTSPDWDNTVTIRRTLADLALARKDFPAAVVQYDALRGDLATGPWAAQMQWRAGAALAQAGDPSKPSGAAQRRWQAAVDADPTSPYAHQSMAALVDAGATVDEYQRGLVNYFNGKYALANAAFERLRASDPTGRKGDAWYYAGLSYLKQGQTNPGLAELGNLIAAYPDNTHWADAWLAQADARARAGDVAGAIDTYRRFAGQRPDAPQAPTALWQAANWQVEAGDLLPAAEAYVALARRYPAADEAWRAYQAAGLIYFQRKDWQRAIATWKEMAEAKLDALTLPVAYFWLGRAQAAAGDTEAAKHSWQAAVQADPHSYYGLRAASWLAAPGATAAQGGLQLSLSTPAAIAKSGGTGERQNGRRSPPGSTAGRERDRSPCPRRSPPMQTGDGAEHCWIWGCDLRAWRRGSACRPSMRRMPGRWRPWRSPSETPGRTGCRPSPRSNWLRSLPQAMSTEHPPRSGGWRIRCRSQTSSGRRQASEAWIHS